MPFHLSNPSNKYSSIEEQRIHELKYKKFLKTLPTNKNNSSEQNLSQQRQVYFNNNYFTQRQTDLQCRQDRRKHEYERIQKENFKFSQRLINAKASLNRNEQQAFFDKHCQLKQRLQHYPDLIDNRMKKLPFSLSPKNPWKIIHKPIDSSFFIYNDKTFSHQSTEIRRKNSLSEKNLPRLTKQNPQSSKLLSRITSNIQMIHASTKMAESSNLESSPTPSFNAIRWNNSTNTKTLHQSTAVNPALNILSSQSSLSDLFI